MKLIGTSRFTCPACGKVEAVALGTEALLCLACGYCENSFGEKGYVELIPQKTKLNKVEVEKK